MNVVKAPRWAWWVATGFGSGRLRPAPGTWGSLAAVAAWCALTRWVVQPILQWTAGVAPDMAPWLGEVLFFALPLGITWLGIKAADLVVHESGLKDPGFIVADEWAGQWIALWPVRWILLTSLPTLGPGRWRGLAVVLPSLLFFRLFDIWKPWPCDALQSLPDGEGVMADDVVAGLYALPLVIALLPALLPYLR